MSDTEKEATMTQAELPYAGTSGWSGTDTSQARARQADTRGHTARRQQQVLALTAARGVFGVTVAEVRETLGLHHGVASGALSVLHKTGRLERIEDKRGRCHVYVMPEFVGGRKTERHGRSTPVGVSDETITIERQRYEDLVSKAEAYDILMQGKGF